MTLLFISSRSSQMGEIMERRGETEGTNKEIKGTNQEIERTNKEIKGTNQEIERTNQETIQEIKHETKKNINPEPKEKRQRPIRILQFGEGNFLRAFSDYMIDIANEKKVFDGSIVVIKPREHGSLDLFRQQECRYTVAIRGVKEGRQVVSNRLVESVVEAVDPYREYETYQKYGNLDSLRFLISNTTEAGIVFRKEDRLDDCPPLSYPGKVTKLLYERYQKFAGDLKKGLILLPLELIDDNGAALKECVQKYAHLWKLEDAFLQWVEGACIFCSTLVDRIVTGYPKEPNDYWKQLGYEDRLLVVTEPYALWVIEAGPEIRKEFPLDRAGLPVIFTDDIKPFKQRKVRILNGAHTSLVPVSYLAGNNLVIESMKDPLIRTFLEQIIFGEIIPTLEMPEADLKAFAHTVFDRFDNPFIEHELLSISLNSIAKWKTRCLPSFVRYVDKNQKLPKGLTFSLAALLAFYRCGYEVRDGNLIGRRGDEKYLIKDEKEVISFFESHIGAIPESHIDAIPESLVDEFLQERSFWGMDLTGFANLKESVLEYLCEMERIGMRSAVQQYFGAESDGVKWN